MCRVIALLVPMSSTTENSQTDIFSTPHAWAIFALWSGILFVLLLGAVTLIFAAFKVRSSLEDSLFYALGASTFLALPAKFASNLFYRWTSSCIWWPSILRLRGSPAPIASTLSGTRPTGWRQATPWSWFNYRFRWAGYAAFEGNCPFWHRFFAWTQLSICGAFLLGITVSGIRFILTGLTASHTRGVNPALLGIAILALPTLTSRALVRRSRIGSLRITLPELEELRSQRTAWRLGELQRSLHTKIVATCFLLAIYTLWWLRVIAAHRAQHPHASWLTPLLWTPFLLYRLWAQFCAPKKAE
jgi:hypothetical protein